MKVYFDETGFFDESGFDETGFFAVTTAHCEVQKYAKNTMSVLGSWFSNKFFLKPPARN